MNFKVEYSAMNIIQRELDKIVADSIENRVVVLFGTSKITTMVHSYLDSKGVDIDIVIDNDINKQLLIGNKFKVEKYNNGQYYQVYRCL